MAILTVMTGHLLTSNNVSHSLVLQAAMTLRDQMWMGVILFFSLSGFLITGILYDTLGKEHYLRTFYGRRVLRIFPLYYGFLLLLLVLTPLFHWDWHGQAYRLWTYTSNIPFIGDWQQNPSPSVNLRHFWSLAVEEQFYLIWPFVILALRSWKKIFLATLIGSALALGLRTALVMNHLGPQNHALPFCMDGLLLGGMLALLVRSQYRAATLRWAPWIAIAAAAVTLAMASRTRDFDWSHSVYLTTIGMTVIALGTTGLVGAALVSGSRTQRFFSARALRFLGTYSYGLYVYHYSIDAALSGRLRGWFELHGYGKMPSILLAAIPVALLSILAAVLSYQLFEKHFLRMKRFFPYRQRLVTEEFARN